MKFFFLIISFVLISPLGVFASIIITEVMYDNPGSDDGKEWVEIMNTGSSSVSIENWKFFESDSNHGLVSSSGNYNLSAGESAVIVDDQSSFVADWPSFAGKLFDSSWSSLSNTGEAIAIKNSSGEIINELTYDPNIGAAGDGKTLQLIGSSWLASTPTPGEVNQASNNNENTDDESTTTDSSLPNNAGTAPPIDDSIKVLFDVPTEVFLKDKIVFSPHFYNSDNSQFFKGYFYINFGDGDSYEFDDRTDFTHAYEYPGFYNLIFEISRYQPVAGQKPDLIIEETIHVIDPSISISSVDLDKGSLTLKSGSSNLNIGGWKISNREVTFTFPKNTIINKNSSLTLSLSKLGFQNPLLGQIYLTATDGNVIDVYEQVSNVVVVKTKKSSTKIDKLNSQAEIEGENSNQGLVESGDDLSAGAILSLKDVNSNRVIKNADNKVVWIIIFIVFVGLMSVSTVFLSLKKIKKTEGVNDSDPDSFKFIE